MHSSIEAARTTYNLQQWGAHYVQIDEHGHVCIHPNGDQHGFRLDDIIERAKQAGLSLPLTLCFDDILQHRVTCLTHAFSKAIEAVEYPAHYTPLYPIKVNQNQHVINTILNTPNIDVGLEAGSKPELLINLAMAPRGAPLVCNGYKDRTYIRLALMAQKSGHNVLLVLEKQSELALILEEAKKLNIRPQLGIRVRLASISAGKWQNTGGAKAKFGLHAAQVLSMIQTLEEAHLLDCLCLLHCHLGSQIAHIRDIQNGLREVAWYYIELKKKCTTLHTVDVGGGLAVDYEGSCSRSECSMNYSLEKYAETVVSTFDELCKQTDTPAPHLMTESGRAMTAHHAMLITDIIDYEYVTEQHPFSDAEKTPSALPLTIANWVEHFHESAYTLAEAHTAFNHGTLSLQERADAEAHYHQIALAIQKNLIPHYRGHHHVLNELEDRLADKVFCNLSIFRSLPDVWAIQQIFPILPTSQLNEPLQRQGIIQDLTCDSDGCIKSYAAHGGVHSTLPLPSYHPQSPFLLAFFMIGAYQDALGDIHNLFGETERATIAMHPNGQDYTLSAVHDSERIKDVLHTVDFDIDHLCQKYKAFLKESPLDEKEKAQFFDELTSCFSSSTYLKPS